MKRLGVISTAVLSLLIGATAPVYAQQEQQGEKQKQEQPGEKQGRPEKQAQPAKQAKPEQQQGKQQQAKPEQQQGKQQQAKPEQQQQQRAQQQQEATPEQQREQRGAWQQHRAQESWQSEHRTWQQRGGSNGYRIDDGYFRSYYGRDHGFRIYSLPFMVVGGYPRFQYGGYWFSLVDPWQEFWGENWYETDDVYVDYDNDGYYMYNRRHPGPGIAITISF
ncbi:MAG: hypothetical protein LAN37_09430 [Acidobacteriia bacterium]|nr:hypothetical protein [Terriglobia bacterium]